MQQKYTDQGAIFSDCRTYRYKLWRIWDNSLPNVMFVGLNPSTADEKKDDPTIRKCVQYAQSWGYGSVYMLNLFAYCATHPMDMKNAENPVGDDNDNHLVNMASQCPMVVAAWGDDGLHLNRSTELRNMIKEKIYCLKISKAGEPRHPRFLPSDIKPILYQQT